MEVTKQQPTKPDALGRPAEATWNAPAAIAWPPPGKPEAPGDIAQEMGDADAAPVKTPWKKTAAVGHPAKAKRRGPPPAAEPPAKKAETSQGSRRPLFLSATNPKTAPTTQPAQPDAPPSVLLGSDRPACGLPGTQLLRRNPGRAAR